MLFVMMTLSFTVAILLAMVVSVFIITRPKVIDWYRIWVSKQTAKFVDDFEKTEL